MGSSVFNDKKMKIMWDNRYNLGVEEIDKEHQRLFAIIRKIVGLVENGEERKAQHACREGVKFFKNYTIIHFAHEENFMSSLNYGGYERHKKIHDDLKKKILPAMEEELEKNNYDAESVRHFLGICTAWLTTHIKVEDQAILNREAGKRMQVEAGSLELRFEKALLKIVHEMYDLEIEPISEHYTGWDFGRAIFHELIFADEKGEITHIIFALEQKLIFSLAQKQLGIEADKMNAFLLGAVKEILRGLGNQIGFYLQLEDQFKSRSGVMLSTGEIAEIFNKRTIHYSKLFRTDMGKFACSVYTR